MKETKQMQVAENLSVNVIQNSDFEFLMTTAEVAKGYGVSPATLRSHKHEHRDELVNGKHYFAAVGFSNAGCKSSSYDTPPPNQTLWTRHGIVRLGFFIKSERAKMFRDWAEDLILSTTEQVEQVEQFKLFPEPIKRKYNRLTPERIISIISDVAKIEDSKLRASIIDKLTNC